MYYSKEQRKTSNKRHVIKEKKEVKNLYDYIPSGVRDNFSYSRSKNVDKYERRGELKVLGMEWNQETFDSYDTLVKFNNMHVKKKY